MGQFLFGLLAGVIVGLVMEWVIDWTGLLPRKQTERNRKAAASGGRPAAGPSDGVSESTIRGQASNPTIADATEE